MKLGRENTSQSQSGLGLDEISPIPAVIKFISAFMNTHLGRCLKYCEISGGMGSGMGGSNNVFVGPFYCLLEELVLVTCSCKSNEVCLYMCVCVYIYIYMVCV